MFAFAISCASFPGSSLIVHSFPTNFPPLVKLHPLGLRCDGVHLTWVRDDVAAAQGDVVVARRPVLRVLLPLAGRLEAWDPLFVDLDHRGDSRQPLALAL